jgi:hypothetical protein
MAEAIGVNSHVDESLASEPAHVNEPVEQGPDDEAT